ncbi:MAG: transporter [Saprospiraceae bacterium]|nr:transporter [Saprospiraceae bacterium]
MKIRSKFLSNTPKAQETDPDDLGFGTKITGDGQRLINSDGTYNVVRQGLTSWTPYQDLVEMSWSRFFLIVLLFYVLVNSFLGLLYLLVGIDNLQGVAPGNLLTDFASAFFFSVQTFTTVGYGAVSPDGYPANILAALGALIGLMSFALATGLVFARFSKPKAAILFSENAIIAPYRGITGFMFRIANKRANKMINLTARVTMSWLEMEDGKKARKFAALKLERDKIYMFPLNWTLVHPIDEESPLHAKTEAELLEMQAEFIILIEGHDETYAQMVHANGSYLSADVRWHKRFEPMYEPTSDGRTLFNLEKINSFQDANMEQQAEA